mmetsp:Transcript_68706/g.119347  ORF Transcript_68706/g.119347 Transcript_68706/m.119347 type:complete len:250 (-) Transcript_68706:1745-2494(-)
MRGLRQHPRCCFTAGVSLNLRQQLTTLRLNRNCARALQASIKLLMKSGQQLSKGWIAKGPLTQHAGFHSLPTSTTEQSKHHGVQHPLHVVPVTGQDFFRVGLGSLLQGFLLDQLLKLPFMMSVLLQAALQPRLQLLIAHLCILSCSLKCRALHTDVPLLGLQSRYALPRLALAPLPDLRQSALHVAAKLLQVCPGLPDMRPQELLDVPKDITLPAVSCLVSRFLGPQLRGLLVRRFQARRKSLVLAFCH